VRCTVENSCADPGPQIYVNSCNQGYLPMLYEESGSTIVVCVAMCQPAVCYNGNCGAGTPPANRAGVAPHRCTAANRPGNYDGTANREHCQHLWLREIDDAGNLLESATSDTLGFCFNMGKYKYDSNSDNKIDASDLNLPDCNNLGSGFGSGTDRTMPNTYFGAADLGCVPTSYLPQAANGKRALPAETMEKRVLTNLPRALYRRHVGTK
jgi:hypothetical protein